MINTPPADRDPLYFHSEPTPVPIFQRDWEFAQLLDMYRTRRPMRTLEIGTYHGGTLYHWLKNAPHGARVVTVDDYTAGVDNRGLYDDWRPPVVDLVIVYGDSQDDATVDLVRQSGPYDWIAIDADHYEASVEADWSNYSSMAAPGAIVALHDIMPTSQDWIQVDRVWRRIQRRGYVTQEIVCDAGLDWSGWGLVYMP